MNPRQKMIKSLLIASISLLIFISGAFYYIYQLRTTLIDELRTNLAQSAEATGMIIEENVNSEIRTITGFADMLGSMQESDASKLVNALKPALDHTNFLRFGVAQLDGNCYTTDGFSFNVYEKPYFQSAIHGVAVFSNTFEDVVSKQNINVFAAPIYQEGTIRYVLFASIEANQLSDKLLIEPFDGKGFCEVANQDGSIIISSDSKNKLQSISSLNQLDFQDDFELSQMKETKAGVTEFKAPNGELRYLAYYHLDINDWYIVSIVPSSVVGEKINHFLQIAMVTWIILACTFTVILCYLSFVRAKADHKMEELIFYDPLTKHYNYNRFRIKVQEILDHHLGKEYAMIEMDIKDFKLFNEFYGYRGGDQLLQIIMDACIKFCSKEEACSRITADRFILLLHTQNQEMILSRMQTILKEIEMRCSKHFALFNLVYKFGIYLLEEDDQQFSKCHDRCAYAKKQISNTTDTFSFFSKAMYETQLSEKKMENLMEDALNHQEFEVYLQPKVSLKDNQIHGAEALVRWNSPIYGLIPPNAFIPLFERNGFLEQLDLMMIRNVCEILTHWQQKGYPKIIISINLSKVYLFKADFMEKLEKTLAIYPIDPSWIEFEITESVIFDRCEELQSIISSLKEKGYHIAMDDFGSGYSSLNMLKNIPIDVMKLDQEFFSTTPENAERSKNIIESVILMARKLHIHTVAEGVEKESEVAFLKKVGCDEIQGYYYSRPLPYAHFIEFYDSFTKRNS